VEHGITEMVNGNDIVEWMLRLQLPHFLKPLDLAAVETERSGWSIEVRAGCHAVHCQLLTEWHQHCDAVVACSSARQSSMQSAGHAAVHLLVRLVTPPDDG
jgi:hypothetical protein